MLEIPKANLFKLRKIGGSWLYGLEILEQLFLVLVQHDEFVGDNNWAIFQARHNCTKQRIRPHFCLSVNLII